MWIGQGIKEKILKPNQNIRTLTVTIVAIIEFLILKYYRSGVPSKGLPVWPANDPLLIPHTFNFHTCRLLPVKIYCQNEKC